MSEGQQKSIDSYIPVKILDNVSDFSWSDTYASAVLNDGTLIMLGHNPGWLRYFPGQKSKNYPTPIKITENVKNISFSDDLCTAIFLDDEIYMWGSDDVNNIFDYPDDGTQIVNVMYKFKDISSNN